MEYGIFTTEGCVERDFYSREEAEAAREARYAEDEAYASPMCREHDGEDAHSCEECNADDPDEDDVEEDDE